MMRILSTFRHCRNLERLIQSSGFSSSSKRLHVCIVGSGPAGCYTAEKMLKSHEQVDIDIVDRLPTPFGLVRSGVAPDHPETKIVVNQFSRTISDERCSYFGNVSIGTSISLSELHSIYDVVVLAYGAESDRSLGICGETLAGIHSAREFVWWYNGHPDFRDLTPDLTTSDTAVIFGQGNVALDVARILLKPPADLATTDIADHALAALQESSVRKVYVIGRRGPAQAACTAKELREILRIKDVNVHIQEADLSKTPLDEEELKRSRIRKRVYDLFSEASASMKSHQGAAQRELHFVFFKRPVNFLSSEDGSHVAGVHLEKTSLKENGGSNTQLAVGTGLFENIDCGLALKSIGYKSVPVEGLPFDNQRGIVPNIQGRVVSDNLDQSRLENGLYAVGWLKRGPTGIIGTNLYCAEETVRSISEDLEKGVVVPAEGSRKAGRDGLLHLLEQRNIRYVPLHGWQKIDSKEKSLGSLRDKPRVKLTSWDELLRAANE